MFQGPTSSIVLALLIDPANPDRVYAGTHEGVFITEDGAKTWRHITEGMFHRNITALAFDPEDSRIVYAGTEGGGIFKYVRP